MEGATRSNTSRGLSNAARRRVSWPEFLPSPPARFRGRQSRAFRWRDAGDASGDHEVDVALRQDKPNRIGLFRVVAHHPRDAFVEPRRQPSEPLGVVQEKIDVLAEPMMHAHHQYCAAAHCDIRRAKAPRLEIVKDGERRREKPLPIRSSIAFGPPPGPSERRARALPIIRPDRFEVHVFVDRVRRAVAAEARLFEAAERRRQRRAVERVDPDRAGAD